MTLVVTDEGDLIDFQFMEKVIFINLQSYTRVFKVAGQFLT